MPRPRVESWKAWAVPWKLVAIVAGSVSRASLSTCVTASLSETPGRRLKESVTAGSWPRWATAERPDVLRERREPRERDEGARLGSHVERGERGRIELVLGRDLHDDLVLVVGRVDRRDLARAVGRVERVLDPRGRDAERRGAVAVDRRR